MNAETSHELSDDPRTRWSTDRHPTDINAGRQLRRRREALNITRPALATLVGVSAQQIEKYESAETRLSASRMHQLGEALGVHPAYFFETKEHGLWRSMVDALRFYAEPKHYEPQPTNVQNAASMDFDNRGGRARAVLANVGRA